MDDKALVLAARALLENVTPLKTDCGAHCGAACCQDPEDGEELLGMELFPGEEKLYARIGDWYKIYCGMDGSRVLVCRGACPRADRPLACRIFPLTPYERDGKMRVRMDLRSASVCPLYQFGKKGLHADFTAAVEKVAAILWQSPKQQAHIRRVSRLIDQQRDLGDLLRGKKE